MTCLQDNTEPSMSRNAHAGVTTEGKRQNAASLSVSGDSHSIPETSGRAEVVIQSDLYGDVQTAEETQQC